MTVQRSHSPRARRRLAAAVAVTTAVLTTATLIAGPASAASTRVAQVAMLCRSRQRMTVHTSSGTRYVVKNDNYGGRPECLAVRGRWPNFTVTNSSALSRNKEPQAYPFILYGCSWGTCSPKSELPRQVSALNRPSATWDTSQHASGKWDASFDIWFGRHAMTTGQAPTEMMIWLNARHVKVSKHTRKVWLDGARWYFLHWRTCHHGACWRYTQFRRVRAVTGVHGLRLTPFIHELEAKHWVRPSWYLEAIDAGFELWHGGAGLATTWFSARA